MPVFFGTGKIGRTVSLEDPAVTGNVKFLSLGEPNLDWKNRRSILTRVTISQRGNFQFLHTLGNDIYIYTFGDRIGAVTISGLALAAECDGTGGDADLHGIEKTLAWYEETRLAVRQAPILINIGVKTVIEGFVVGIDSDVVDPMTRVVQFNISLVNLPKKAPKKKAPK